MAYLFVNVGDDPAAARAETAAFLGGTYRQDFDAMVDRVAVAGDAAQVAAKVHEFVDAGARHLIFTPASRTTSLQIAERIAADVMPQFAPSATLRPDMQ
jgi:alkanesulfonate monooxygenase SsuD/methylene tetrahydromethanopterin reductase-like flavin-dependent oxidoreductase (luciferase family)